MSGGMDSDKRDRDPASWYKKIIERADHLLKPQHEKAYNHYYRECPYEYVDIYRVLDLFDVTDPCLQHAIKKLMVAGGRGSKDIEKDVAEAIVTLTRWQEMRKEDQRHGV